MAIVPTAGDVFRGGVQGVIHFLEFGIVIRVGHGSHDPEKLLRADHQFNPVRPSFSERFHGFIAHRHIVGSFVGKHDAIQQRDGVVVVCLVETFQRDLRATTGTVFNTRHVMIRADIFHPVLFVDQVPLLISVSHGRVRRELVIASRVGVNEPFRRKRVGEGETGG